MANNIDHLAVASNEEFVAGTILKRFQESPVDIRDIPTFTVKMAKQAFRMVCTTVLLSGSTYTFVDENLPEALAQVLERYMLSVDWEAIILILNS